MINLQNLLTEHPDFVKNDDEYDEWMFDYSDADGVFSVFLDKITSKWVAAVMDWNFATTSDSGINKQLLGPGRPGMRVDTKYSPTHPELLRVFVKMGRIK